MRASGTGAALNRQWQTRDPINLKPSSPSEGWIPRTKAGYYRCVAGLGAFTASHFFMTAIMVTCVYNHFDSFRPVAIVFATEFSLVCLFKQFVDGAEMFSFSLVTAPSKVDYVLGLLIKVSRTLRERVLLRLLLRTALLTASSNKLRSVFFSLRHIRDILCCVSLSM